jgi:small subunit ribosomal protein S3
MEAGALGVEIIISGKLRTDRARYEKFRTGYLPKSGEPPRRYMRTAELHVQTKPGMLGVKVSLLPPDAVFPDKISEHIVEEDLYREPPRQVLLEKPAAEAETAPAEVAEPVAEPEALPEAEPAVAEESPVEAPVETVDEPVAAEKPEAEQKEAEAAPVDENKEAEE